MTDQSDDDPMASVRPYLQLASGILGMSAAKAAEMAQGLWAQGGDIVGDAANDVVGSTVDQGRQVAAMLSPDQVRSLVREEVDRVVRRLGFAREDEMASLRREVGRLEQQVAALEGQLHETRAAAGEHAPAGKGGGKGGKKKKGDREG